MFEYLEPDASGASNIPPFQSAKSQPRPEQVGHPLRARLGIVREASPERRIAPSKPSTPTATATPTTVATPSHAAQQRSAERSLPRRDGVEGHSDENSDENLAD